MRESNHRRQTFKCHHHHHHHHHHQFTSFDEFEFSTRRKKSTRIGSWKKICSTLIRSLFYENSTKTFMFEKSIIQNEWWVWWIISLWNNEIKTKHKYYWTRSTSDKLAYPLFKDTQTNTVTNDKKVVVWFLLIPFDWLMWPRMKQEEWEEQEKKVNRLSNQIRKQYGYFIIIDNRKQQFFFVLFSLISI